MKKTFLISMKLLCSINNYLKSNRIKKGNLQGIKVNKKD